MKTKINMLPVITVPIQKGQYLSDIPQFNPIGTNIILHKKLPNVGGTHGEILSKRHTIIVEAHVPVIKGKASKHTHILAVHKGIYKDNVIEYLESNIPFKKIICTPEAFIKKVKPAIADHGKFDMYKDFTLMLDECDHIITDVDYRSAIIGPMDDFFLFENKFMISATPLPPTYPKFIETGFKFVELQPQFDYTKDLNLICTNNVVGAFKELLKSNADKQLFIFVNSTDTILGLINMLDIAKDSYVYCGEDSVKKLKAERITNAFMDLGAFGKFNFFTSRFFSAVDIDLDFKPNVVMITDVFFAKHSILDPQTEIIQICGRFRNGIGEVTHISNVNPQIEFKTPLEANQYLNGRHSIYMQFLAFLHTQPDLDQGSKDTLTQALERVDHARFVTQDGKMNYFMKDNFINEERVKSYYKDIPSLNTAYKNVSHFNLNSEYISFPLGDDDRLRRIQTREQKEFYKLIAQQLEKLYEPRSSKIFQRLEYRNNELRDLQLRCPEIYTAYHAIGLQGLEEAGYRLSKIRKAVRTKNKENSISNEEMIDVIYEEFAIGRSYSEQAIVKKLREIYAEFNIDFKVAASHITRYFVTTRTSLKDGEKAYYLTSRKFLTQTEMSDNNFVRVSKIKIE